MKSKVCCCTRLHPSPLVEAVRAEQAGAWTKKPIQVPTWGPGDVGITFAAWFFLSMVAGIAAFAITDGAGVRCSSKGSSRFAVMIPWIGMGGWPPLATSTKGNGPSIDLLGCAGQCATLRGA